MGLPVTVKGPDSIPPVKASGSAAMSVLASPRGRFKIHSVLCHFSSAPTTSENFVVTLVDKDGSVYSTVLYTVNPSTGAVTDIVNHWEGGFPCPEGSEIKVTYTNTDARTWGLTIMLAAV